MLVAQQLRKLGIKTCFLNLSGQPNIIKEAAEEIGCNDFVEHKVKVYNYKKPPIVYARYLLNAKINRLIFGIIANSRRKRHDSFNTQGCENDELRHLLKQLNFDSTAIIKKYCRFNIDRWIFHIKLAENKIKEIKPDCVIYDLEMQSEIRSFIFAAKKEKIPVVSMQHAEGFGAPYSNLSKLADYYIAYSPYNVENIKSTQVDDKNIFLTGSPDTDIIYDSDSEKIKKELQGKYGVNFGKKIILVALRPSNINSLNDANARLMNSTAKAFGGDNRFYILVKQHNADYILGSVFPSHNLDYDNFIKIDSDYPFWKILKVSRYMISHISACIVEAGLMNVPSIVIEFDNYVEWPPWNMYSTFHYIRETDTENILTKIKDDSYVFKPTEEARQRFIERFRFKFDNKSAERIAEAINSVII